MDWVKLSTRYYLDPAVLGLGQDAELLFIRALAYCGAAETGGFIPRGCLELLTRRNPRKSIDALVSSGLWQPVAAGWVIRSWEHWQADADVISERRRRDRERKAALRADGGRRPRNVRGTSADMSAEFRPTEREGEREEKPSILQNLSRRDSRSSMDGD